YLIEIVEWASPALKGKSTGGATRKKEIDDDDPLASHLVQSDVAPLMIEQRHRRQLRARRGPFRRSVGSRGGRDEKQKTDEPQ
ncbi:hypothetical protein, partial [Methylosinus sp. KRF6]|uniref:hypothetical protein n=1 Tax=Methylosinus sp. KRF6 TaxID=2846853 RepID=UPI001C0E4879